MWQRRTFHGCAEELEIVSKNFRRAYTDSSSIDLENRTRILRESSEKGIEILRVLALSIRSEQDFGNVPRSSITVGALNDAASESEITTILSNYQPPYEKQSDFEPLVLREALNKIAHANPSKAGFFANTATHDLILSGKKRNRNWIAILSIVDLCRAIKSLPDRATRQD